MSTSGACGPTRTQTWNSFFVFVDIDRVAGNSRLEQDLNAVTGVQEVHQVAGEDGYLLKLRAANPASLGQTLNRELLAIQGVRSTRTHVVLNTLKETRRIDLDRSLSLPT
jgi:Lrp/AsnC family leucine-responsive transcriptional regulator